MAEASVVGETNRLTYRAFAAKRFNGDVHKLSRYSAAGRFSCVGFFTASGTIVGKPDVLVLAAHSVYEKDKNGKCSPRPYLQSCYFEPINVDGSYSNRKYRIVPNTVKVSGDYQCEGSDLDIDWAVVRLQDRVTHVTPFTPFRVNDAVEMRKRNVVSFAASADNFRRGEVPTICEGELHFVWPPSHFRDGGAPYSSADSDGIAIDCSAGGGTSGGAVILDDQNQGPQFIGLISAGTTDSQSEKEYHNFSIHNYSGGPLFYGDFYTAVMKIMDVSD